jgi:hypothetical protein
MNFHLNAGIKMSKKGIVLLTKSMIESLVIIALILFVTFAFIGRYFQMEVVLAEESYARLGIQLANILLSYPGLMAEEGGRMSKGIFDYQKIQKLATDNDAKRRLYEEISLPESTSLTYEIVIYNLTSEEFRIENLLPGTEFIEKFKEKFPIAVKIGLEKRPYIMEIVLGNITTIEMPGSYW